jgi:hypothetical protein
MAESITISKIPAESKSMQYKFLREEGIKHIQKLAGDIWTDYNIHDPGVTILEVLCYAITELGYRSSYAIKDLLATDPNDKTAADILNFFTARQILHNYPVTINDYRKLIIDVDVYDPDNVGCEHVGVKNAWVEKSATNELSVYVHKKESLLSYDPDPVLAIKKKSSMPLEIGVLYDVLLEFEKCDAYGDLNSNSIISDFNVAPHPLDKPVQSVIITVKIEFPRWDNADVNWENNNDIKSRIQKITILYDGVPNGYEFSHEIINNNIKLTGKKSSGGITTDIAGITEIEARLNDFVYLGNESMLAFYLKKIGKIREIIEVVKARLHKHRNLCEDFLHFNALKVENIAVCADIDLDNKADVEEVQAIIFHEIAKFLSPAVNFYSLPEMLDKCMETKEYSIVKINVEPYAFTINSDTSELLQQGDTITISGSTNNDGEYTVASVAFVPKKNQTVINVVEDIPSELLTESEILSFTVSDKNCLTVDEIFEGPRLDHGFIDNNELEKADRKTYVHVSDLIRIIMAVPGVIAVKSIQIASLPQDNDDNSIISKSVKWCLQLAFEENYVPRLSIIDSKITFYKDKLPYKASQHEVEGLIDDLQKKERTAKLFDNPQLDFGMPKGEYKNIESYSSIQNDFPLTYGIGEEGLPGHVSLERKAQAKQLKGFLMIFDQLLANYMSQLAHVKELFTLNAAKDDADNYIIGRTYYTQPLFENNIAPNVDELYINKAGHITALNQIVEDKELFGIRKNKFLDHLMARFAEQFTDYALLTFKFSGENKAPEELIEDKLEFLNSYPQISEERGKGFNYMSLCELWHINNISGLEQRASFLTGIDDRNLDELHFSLAFSIEASGDQYIIRVKNSVPSLIFKSHQLYDTLDDATTALEKLIVIGVIKEKYIKKLEDGSEYSVQLLCDNELWGSSDKTDLTENEADDLIDELVEIFEQEFYLNIESSRKNLSCAYNNYIQHTIEVEMGTNPIYYTVSFKIYDHAFHFDDGPIMEGSYKTEGPAKSMVDAASVDVAAKKIVVDGNIGVFLNPGDKIVIDNSQDNDGVYTIVGAADVDSSTEITVNEEIPSDTVPLGELYYNKISEAEFQKQAENHVPNILWELINAARNQDRYYFNPDEGSPYVFRLDNRYGEVMAESTASEFNEALATEIEDVGKAFIEGSTDNDGEYTVLKAEAFGPLVEITIDQALPSNIVDGVLSFSESFDYTVDPAQYKIVLEENLSMKIDKGDKVEIRGSESNDGAYTLLKITWNGSTTVLIVDEPIPSNDTTGKLHYLKSFSITDSNSDIITIKGGYEDKTVAKTADFFTNTFFSREGMHVLEHILLRPKVRGTFFVTADENSLDDTLADLGSLVFSKNVDIFSISTATNTIRVGGALSSEMGLLKKNKLEPSFTIEGTNINDGNYTIRGLSYDSSAGRTKINIEGNIVASISSGDAKGKIMFKKISPITEMSSTDLMIMVDDVDALALKKGDVAEVINSTDGINDGRYIAEKVEEEGGSIKLYISKKEQEIEDSLLPIVLSEEDCDACQIEDPYTCIVSVILPHWQGRFDNIEFRRFFERQIRLEAPAHTFLNICWISCGQMAEFETRYKAWLVENNKREKDCALLSQRLNELIDIFSQLRNVYPSGKLHDCAKDETLEHAIILNNSVLGNA